MKNTANKARTARQAYRALVAARTAGKALAAIGSQEAARKAISSTRQEARLELEIEAHYPNRVLENDRTTWWSEDNDGEPFCLENDGEWAFEALSFHLHNNLGEYVQFEYKASYHIGQEQDSSLEFKASYYATDDDDKKRSLSTVSAYKSARRYADRLARQSFEKRGREEYGRLSPYDDDNASWYLREEVIPEWGCGYTVEVTDDNSGETVLTVSYTEDGRLVEARDGDDNLVTPTEREEEATRGAVENFLSDLKTRFNKY